MPVIELYINGIMRDILLFVCVLLFSTRRSISAVASRGSLLHCGLALHFEEVSTLSIHSAVDGYLGCILTFGHHK